ncbi:MAG: nicotinate-nucleotide--dimethylbenzimidazole phosphoribosyltransferase [Chloroflexota bacterium]
MNLKSTFDKITPLDSEAMKAAEERQGQLTKPAGSLGRLEALSIQLAGITGEARPMFEQKAIVVMAGDHGVTAEGVSAFPAEVTPQMVMNFLFGGAAINALSGVSGSQVMVVDMGVASELPAHNGLISKRIAAGTANMVQGPAMNTEQAVQALEAGIEVVNDLKAQGVSIVGLGDMGIGNTTPSAAIACAIMGTSPDDIVGRGTGVDDAGLKRKKDAVAKAIVKNEPDGADGLDVLMKVGGFEIGGLAGVVLGAAANKMPVVVDGFITTAAALIAAQICPAVKDYLIPSHCSQESGHEKMLAHLGLKAMFDYEMRLGEGSGAALAMPVVDAAADPSPKRIS